MIGFALNADTPPQVLLAGAGVLQHIPASAEEQGGTLPQLARRYGTADMAAKAAAHITEPLQAEWALVERIQADPHHEVALCAILMGDHTSLAAPPGRSCGGPGHLEVGLSPTVTDLRQL